MFMHRKCVLLTGIVAMLLWTAASCRVNNGDIGPLYGVWAVERVDVDGEVYDGWRQDGYDDSFFQFQNNICFVTRTTDRFEAQNVACTWRWVKEDTEMELDFTHTDNIYPEPGGATYMSPYWLLLSEPVRYDVSVSWKGNRNMTWNVVNTDGRHITYHLKKTY